MKHINYLFLLAVICSILSYGCSSSDNEVVEEIPSDETVVSFTTSVYTRAVVTELKDGDEMNMYAKEYRTLTSSDIVSGQLKAVGKGGVWYSEPKIVLESGDKAFIYAFYPYDKANVNPEAIPVDAGRQIDYLYSGEGELVSYQKPQTKLTMSHALSVFSFNIRKSNYSGKGVLQEIRIEGDDYAVQGTLNVRTGEITKGENGKLVIKCEKTVSSGGWTDDLPQAFTLPASSNGKNLKFIFKVDGRESVVVLPVLEFESGMKYVFRLGLTDNNMTLFADQIESVSLNIDKDKMPVEGEASIIGVGFNGQNFVLPEMSGDGMTPGMVNWGDGNTEIYTVNGEHRYSEYKEYNIEIENWKTEEITFSNLKGIETIDLSGF
ncbi:fimbrillin family protein [uncultured Bacteroides sp.]|uniref:fimbrillin family protein n=1 Tax=uncultured Bacteroides sp. TaxID=162156 RepID=UPI0026395CBF|nr:fimbrillin family protein [uncultured Bacteroides sp.]